MKRDVSELKPLVAPKRVAYGDEPSQFFDVWSATAPRATIVFVHGGFWRAKYDLGHASFLCAALAGKGFNVANLEYRRVGEPGGGWDGSFLDVILGIEVAASELGSAKTIVCGHSAGGHLALMIAALETAEVDGVVALAPVASLRTAYELHLSNDAVVEFMGGTPQQRSSEYDVACPTRHHMVKPVTVLHGSDDDVVPIRLSKEFAEARKGDGVRLVELASTGHMELIDPEDASFASVVSALESML